MKTCINTLTNQVLTEEEFIEDCKNYIESTDWGDESRPTLREVMLNTDYVVEIE